jgi:hypothetical protein
MSDRFDLEQEILECWKVTNDMQMFIDQNANIEDLKILIDYYECKFEKLWNTFEGLVKTRSLE